MFVNYMEMNQSNFKPLDDDGDEAMGDSSEGVRSSTSRGQKRPHHHGCQSNGYSVGGPHNIPCECQNVQDDVDLPLSKRICKLQIEHSNETGQNSSEDQIRVSPPQQQNDLQGNPDPKLVTEENRNGFSSNYPYDVNSPYYANNQLLYNLYLERTRRQEQQLDVGAGGRQQPSPANSTS